MQELKQRDVGGAERAGVGVACMERISDCVRQLHETGDGGVELEPVESPRDGIDGLMGLPDQRPTSALCLLTSAFYLLPHVPDAPQKPVRAGDGVVRPLCFFL